MNSLLQLDKNMSYDPSRLSPKVVVVLSANLPRHGLKPFLQRHPKLFTVELGTGKSWQLIVHDVSSTSSSGAAPCLPTSAGSSGINASSQLNMLD